LFLRGRYAFLTHFAISPLLSLSEPSLGAKSAAREKEIDTNLVEWIDRKTENRTSSQSIAVTMQTETERTLPENQTQTRQKTNPKTTKPS
jgi:hypothetical protein